MLKHLLKIIMINLRKKTDKSFFYAKNEFIFLLTFLFNSGINHVVYIILNVVQSLQVSYFPLSIIDKSVGNPALLNQFLRIITLDFLDLSTTQQSLMMIGILVGILGFILIAGII